MKRLACAALALLLITGVCGCAKKEKPPVTLDLEYFVRLGRIPECGCVLGVSAAEIEKVAEKATEKNGFICLEKDNALYCYRTGDESKTVKYMVSFKGAYGFSAGTSSGYITSELARGDMNAPLLPLEPDDVFYAEEGEYEGIKYTYGVNTTCFVFRQNKLWACAMY